MFGRNSAMLVTLMLVAAVAEAEECSQRSGASCEEGDGTGFLQVSSEGSASIGSPSAVVPCASSTATSSVHVKVCGFESPSDPVAIVAPVCVDGFNKAMADGCQPGLYQMLIIKNESAAYCAYTGGWALDGYAGQGCNSDTFFTMPGMDGPLFFDGNAVTNVGGTMLAQFSGLAQDYSSKFSCNSGTCIYSGSGGPSITISSTDGGDKIPTGVVPQAGVSFTWDASLGYVMFSRYDPATSSIIQAMSLKPEDNGGNGLSEQSGDMGTCNSIIQSWPITGVDACTQVKDVFAPVSSGDSITLNCS